MGRLVAAAVIVTAWIVAPLHGAEPGLQSSLKLAALVVLATIIALRGTKSRHDTRHGELALGAFWVSAIISTIACDETLATSAPTVISLGCLWVITRAARQDPEAGERAVAVACAGLVVVAGIELLGAELPWSWNRRPESTVGNRNHLAEYLAIALPILVLRATRGGRAARMLVVGVIAMIVATHCRTAYLAGFVACGVAVAWNPRRAPRWLIVGVVVAIACGAAPWPGVRFTRSAGDSLSRVFTIEGSGESRLAQHRRGLAALHDPGVAVVGAGPGSWMRVAGTHAHASGDHAPRLSGATTPNSEWLRTGVEQGVLGIVVLFGIAAGAIRAAVRDPNRERRAARLATLAAIAVVGTFDPLIARPEVIALLAVVLARRGAAADDIDHPPLVRSWCLVAACGVAAIVASVRCASFVASSTGSFEVAARLWPRPGLVERRVLQLANRGACREAERIHGELAAERPYVWGPRVALARCYARAHGVSDERRIWRSALAIEPHLRELVNRKEER